MDTNEWGHAARLGFTHSGHVSRASNATRSPLKYSETVAGSRPSPSARPLSGFSRAFQAPRRSGISTEGAVLFIVEHYHSHAFAHCSAYQVGTNTMSRVSELR